jgi:hypothetical protein
MLALAVYSFGRHRVVNHADTRLVVQPRRLVLAEHDQDVLGMSDGPRDHDPAESGLHILKGHFGSIPGMYRVT